MKVQVLVFLVVVLSTISTAAAEEPCPAGKVCRVARGVEPMEELSLPACYTKPAKDKSIVFLFTEEYVLLCYGDVCLRKVGQKFRFGLIMVEAWKVFGLKQNCRGNDVAAAFHAALEGFHEWYLDKVIVVEANRCVCPEDEGCLEDCCPKCPVCSPKKELK